MYIKPKDMFNLIEVSQDILGKLAPVNDYVVVRLGEVNTTSLTNEEFIIMRDALIEANKMRIALDRISKIMVTEHNIPTSAFPILNTVIDISKRGLNLIKY